MVLTKLRSHREQAGRFFSMFVLSKKCWHRFENIIGMKKWQKAKILLRTSKKRQNTARKSKILIGILLKKL
jgi:hypothetical protein